jgi:hypothetical protein
LIRAEGLAFPKSVFSVVGMDADRITSAKLQAMLGIGKDRRNSLSRLKARKSERSCLELAATAH